MGARECHGGPAALAEIYAGQVQPDGRRLALAPTEMSDAEVAEVLEILERSGAREHTAEARRFRDLALELLDQLPCLPRARGTSRRSSAR